MVRVLRLLVLLLVLLSLACASAVRVEPTRGAVQHERFVRVVARDAVPGEIKVLVMNLGDEPITVLSDSIVIEAHFGPFQRAKKGKTWTVPPQGSQLVTLRFAAQGLEKNDDIIVSFDDAILRGERSAQLNTLQFRVTRGN